MRHFILVFTLLILSAVSVPANAQSTGSAAGGERSNTTTCALGATACVEEHDRLCRAQGSSVSLRSVGLNALALTCASGGASSGTVSSQPPETRGCISGGICHCSGSSDSGFGSVYMCMNNMINECLSSGGKATGLGIYPDADNDGISVATGSCIAR